ncbi:Alpha/Beta hydrolase protein [Xylariaceae sp. FL0255]|nr:Alpha/Beta hydrolase protein [Xylariaceae sp. FL0255]
MLDSFSMLRLLAIFSVLLHYNLLAEVSSTRPNPPAITLQWGIYQGEVDEYDSQIIRFGDVRFGATPPRFNKPSSPAAVDALTVQPDLGGVSCIQASISALTNAPRGHRAMLSLGEQGRDYHSVLARHGLAARSAYIFGRLSLLWGNYRLGAYGWLAGNYMQKSVQPNAGLYDQALLLDWVQQYICLFGGDNTKVSAWGESAGVGSVLHHLIREHGRVNPDFGTFAIQSPAFEWSWDNSANGALDRIYQNFSELAGCGAAYDIDCLSQSNQLKEANAQLVTDLYATGLFPLGPAVNGQWISPIPDVSLTSAFNLYIKSPVY